MPSVAKHFIFAKHLIFKKLIVENRLNFARKIKIPPSGQESGIENVKILSRFMELKTNSVNRLNVINVIHLLELLPYVTDMLLK